MMAKDHASEAVDSMRVRMMSGLKKAKSTTLMNINTLSIKIQKSNMIMRVSMAINMTLIKTAHLVNNSSILKINILTIPPNITLKTQIIIVTVTL